MALATGHRVGLAFIIGAALAGCPPCVSHSATVPSTPTSSNPSTSKVVPPCNLRIRRAVVRFFTAWDRHDKADLGRLFGAQGELDMATKYQDTLHDSEWTAVSGRIAIEAFAARQWRFGETFSYGSMTIYPPQDGGVGGAEMDQVGVRFADGSVQPIEEAKFNYDCSQKAFIHVVIISAAKARKPPAAPPLAAHPRLKRTAPLDGEDVPSL